MANIHQSITELIGNTPLLQLNRYTARRGITATILAKLEYFNPAGSAKDRIAWSMIEAALASGELTPASTIVEVTSGNTGIAEAAIAASQGIPATILLASNTSAERQALLRAYGATIVMIPDVSGQEAVEALLATAEGTPNAWVPSQFTNDNNPRIHRATTGPEIYRDTDGNVDFLVAGLGTGGTASGAGEFLKSVLPDVRVVGVEPADEASADFTGKGVDGIHQLLELEDDVRPTTFHGEVVDEVLYAPNEASWQAARDLAREEGLLVGASSGAALLAAVEIARRPGNEDATIVVVFPDTGERYLSTVFAADQYPDEA